MRRSCPNIALERAAKKRQPNQPLSKSAKKAQATAASVDAKYDFKLTLEGCKWTRKTKCCSKACCDQYKPEMVQAVRQWTMPLPKGDQRAFLSHRMYQPMLGEQCERKPRTHCFFEKSELVLDKFGNRGPHCLDSAYPQDDTIQYVCQSMLVFMVGRSTSFISGSINSKGRLIVDPDRREEYTHRQSPVATGIGMWLRQAGEYHGIKIPNPEGKHEYMVLPWPGPRETYQAYRLDKLVDRHKKLEDSEASADQESGVAFAAAREATRVMMEEAGSADAEKAIPHEDPSLRIAALSYFKWVWRETDALRRKYRVRKVLPFSKCTICETNRSMREKTNDSGTNATLKAELREHLIFVRDTREGYYRRRLLAHQFPDEYMSVIIDGADQSRYDVPYTHQKSKLNDANWGMKMHTIGAILHGRAVYAFTCPDHVEQGHNVTIQALHDVLLDQIQKGRSIPPRLFLQLDNTTKQCKGRYVFGYLGLLIKLGVFQRITVSFLPVGHTHEDIDQLFSRISVRLHKHDHYSRIGLEKSIRESYKGWGGKPIVRHWDTLANMSGFLETYLPKKGFETCTEYHQFRFFKMQDSQKVVVQSREWSVGEWTWGGMPRDQHNFNELFPTVFPPISEWRNTFPPTNIRPISEDTLVKISAGYTEVARRYNIPDEDLKDLDTIYKLLSREDPIPFAWSPEDIDELYGSGEHNQAPAEEDEVALDHVLVIKPIINRYYLVTPSNRNHEKFWVGQCKAVGEKVWVENENTHRPGMRINYFELTHQDHAGDLTAELKATRTPLVTNKNAPYANSHSTRFHSLLLLCPAICYHHNFLVPLSWQ